MKRQLMGYGATADVYEWHDHTVLKLFKADIEDQVIEYEALIHEMIYDKGLQMPKLIEEVEVDGRRGFVYSRVNGKTLLFQMMKKKWKMRSYGKIIANAHLEIHKMSGPLLPDVREHLRADIHKVQSFTVSEGEALMAQIDKLPTGNTICHMDFHPANIFYNEKTTTTIDWITGSRSTPAADVARTYLLLKYGGLDLNGPNWLVGLEHLGRAIMLRSYLHYYLKKSSITFEDVRIWLKPIAAARMSEDIDEAEKQQLYDKYINI